MKKTRTDKTVEESTRKVKGPDPNRMTVPRGRAGSAWRPGLLIKKHFEENPESCCADAYYNLSRQLEAINRERVEIGEKPFRRPNYSSFAKYFHWFLILKLIERTGKIESAIYNFLRKRVYYRLTGKGRTEKRAWENPVRAAHPELGGGQP